jgi:hypothetical protein
LASSDKNEVDDVSSTSDCINCVLSAWFPLVSTFQLSWTHVPPIHTMYMCDRCVIGYDTYVHDVVQIPLHDLLWAHTQNGRSEHIFSLVFAIRGCWALLIPKLVFCLAGGTINVCKNAVYCWIKTLRGQIFGFSVNHNLLDENFNFVTYEYSNWRVQQDLSFDTPFNLL